MKISYNWLKQFLHLDWDAEKAGELLTDLGLEVEGIQSFESIKGGLKGVVVGHITECNQHPNADRLKLTKVDVGENQILQVVCGAPNVAAGQKVAVATIGTKLYNAEGEEWVIKKGKIRGEVSEGMLCAEDELGLGESHDGIMVLDSKLKPGTPCATLFEVETDQVFEIGLTPNRADAMSHHGVARDLKAGLMHQDITLELITPSASNFGVDVRTKRVEIKVENPELAPRYCGITISDVKVASSPAWLQNRLKAIGLAPINNVVDITNYVLHELGQPLHAFDLNKINSNKVHVKTLPKGSKFVTLDGIERELHEEDLMICDADKPMCIAGVFGGMHSGITENSTEVFLESAYFDPVSVRKTAKRHGLNTDASFRFERGINIEMCDYALRRAALMIKEIAGGTISSDLKDLYPKKFDDFQVFLHFEKVSKLIGQDIDREIIKSILTSLEIKVNNITESGIGLTIPSYRVDVQREADVIEEILRVYGYNQIEISSKLNASIASTTRLEDYKLQDIIGNQLVSQGFYEILANSLSNPDYIEHLEDLDKAHNVKIINPLSSDLAILRRSMLFSGLEAIAHNINRKQSNLRLFEFGKSYHHYGETREEQKHLSLYLTGNLMEESWRQANQSSDFFYLKGILKNIFDRLGIKKIKSAPAKSTIYSEGLRYTWNKKKLVEFGVVRSKIVKSFGIKQQVLFADIHWDVVLEAVQRTTVKFEEISKFPSVRRDLALLLDEKTSFNDLHMAAMQTEKQFLTNIDLFDVYTGDNLPAGKKSYALSFILENPKATLTDKQIDKIMTKLQNSFQKQFEAEIR
ncbi:MAG: phenylalanine--tRNA ligase subunit beta [Flavobacteriaceae bacterium]|nr:phenylalanine--tRNA ligase subunit beta [Flavobacteriaceae bacterium]